MFPSSASAASPAENFTGEWARLVTGPLGPVNAPQLTTQQSPDGWTGVIGVTSVARDGANSLLLLVTTTGFGRTMSALATLTDQARASEVTQFFERLELRADASTASPKPAAGTSTVSGGESAAKALATLAPSTEVVAVASGSVTGGVPAGLFYRVTAGFTRFSRVTAETRLFLPGNRIVRTFPYGGGDTFAMSRCLPDTCGTYRIDGDFLTVNWANRPIERWTFGLAREGIELDGATFRPVRSVTREALLGEWSDAGSDGNPYANVYRFSQNGTFTFGSSSTPLTGRFAVDGMTLILSFADGDVSRRTLFAADTSNSVALICIDGAVYGRR